MAKKDKGLGGAPLGEFKEMAAPEEKVKPAAPKDNRPAREKKPNIFKRFGRFLKEVVLELKKVTWPPIYERKKDGEKGEKRANVVMQTIIVLVVVVIFLLILLAIDSALAALLDLLVDSGA